MTFAAEDSAFVGLKYLDSDAPALATKEASTAIKPRLKLLIFTTEATPFPSAHARAADARLRLILVVEIPAITFLSKAKGGS